MRSGDHSDNVPSFDDILAEFLDEPAEVLASLSDVVNKGRIQAEHLEPEAVSALGKYDLIVYLIQRTPGRPVRTWLYPSPLGLKMFSVLEREAEREEERQQRLKAKARNRRRPGTTDA